MKKLNRNNNYNLIGNINVVLNDHKYDILKNGRRQIFAIESTGQLPASNQNIHS
jgi:hypothetical protein